ncbi:GTP 3',8-cyclase MoaA, partial [Candidatus Bathyarchaeota archaeon]
NRLRVTSSGKLKPCLMRPNNYVDFVSLLRKNASEEELHKAFVEAVMRREPYFRK